MKLFFLIFMFSVPVVSSARVFNITEESFATYLKLSYGTGLENTLVSGADSSSGVDITLDPDHSYMSSGEWGFVYSNRVVGLRLAVELIRPPRWQEREAKNASGTSLYTLNADQSVFIPKAGLEINFTRTLHSRMFMYLGVGSGSLKSAHEYNFTTDGDGAYNPLTSFFEQVEGTAPLYEGSFGYEGLLADSTTYSFDIGYRYLEFSELKHTRATTGFGGTVADGDIAKNIDGTDRTLSLSGVYVGFALRWWLQ